MCEECLSFAVVAAEFWSLQKKYGYQRTNRVRKTLGVGVDARGGGVPSRAPLPLPSPSQP